MPQPKHKSEDDELRRVVATINQSHKGTPRGELIVDPEARGNKTRARDYASQNCSLKWRIRCDPNCKRTGGDHGKQETHAEHPVGMMSLSGLIVLAGFSIPETAEKGLRIPEAA